MEFKDERAATATEVAEETNVVQLPEGLPEGLVQPIAPGQSSIDDPAATTEEATPEEQEKMIAELQEKAAAAEKEITTLLAPLGTYLLIRFENPMSIRHTITIPEDERLRPDTRALRAVFDEEIRKLTIFEQEALLTRTRKMQEANHDGAMKVLGLNREERRIVDKLVRAGVVSFNG